MQIAKSLILGLVQGLTEFLPVSSSGHLVLGKQLLGLQEQGIVFEVFLHFGTMLAVLTVFSRDILNLIKTFFAFFTLGFHKNGLQSQYQSNTDFRLLIFILAASVPAGVIGFIFENKIEATFGNPHLTSIMLIVTSLILFLTYFAKKTAKPLNFKNTFFTGIAQAVAILPGISRSGSTISAALYQGVEAGQAARFSFLLAVPAIMGATMIKSVEVIKTGISGDMFLVLAVGMFAAYISGLFAIQSMLAIVRRGKLYFFAPYCLILGILGLLFIKA
jgi:undecaprenyl-diphosphatase